MTVKASKKRSTAAATFSVPVPGDSVELALLRVDDTMGLCRFAGTKKKTKLRAKNIWMQLPGEILTVEVRSVGPTTLSGTIIGSTINATKLGLKPLALEKFEDWDPAEEYWGEEGEPLPDWALPIVKRGPRPCYEMEQVIPGVDRSDPNHDPIIAVVDAREAGDLAWAYHTLHSLLARDLRCLDAHVHLGNFDFDHNRKRALRHYEIGVAIGNLSLPPGRDFVIAWGLIDNRPYLRCLHGKVLCLWRIGELEQAAKIFENMLWLNPSDNQGARFCLADCLRGDVWTGD